jgi:hypothetical protein
MEGAPHLLTAQSPETNGGVAWRDERSRRHFVVLAVIERFPATRCLLVMRVRLRASRRKRARKRLALSPG